MKFTKLIAVLILFSLFSCENIEESKTEKVDLEDDIIQINELIIDSTLKENESKYNYFEDYIIFKTKADLIKEFGEITLLDGISWYAEGEVKREHSLLVNPKNGHMIKFIWSDETDSLESIEASYYLWDDNSEIDGYQDLDAKNGLKLGMSLDELKKWNGTDFKFSGFGWDYAGGVFVEEGGKLFNSKVIVTLINNQINLDDTYNFMIGDIELNTADEKLIGAPVLVEQFTYHMRD